MCVGQLGKKSGRQTGDYMATKTMEDVARKLRLQILSGGKWGAAGRFWAGCTTITVLFGRTLSGGCAYEGQARGET